MTLIIVLFEGILCWVEKSIGVFPEARLETVRILKDSCKHTNKMDRKVYETLNTNEELTVLFLITVTIMVRSLYLGAAIPQNVDEGTYLVHRAQERSSREKFFNFGDLSAKLGRSFRGQRTSTRPRNQQEMGSLETHFEYIPLRLLSSLISY